MFRWHTQGMGEGACPLIAPRRTTIDVGVTLRHRLRVGPATRIPALPALGLWKQAVEAFYEIGVQDKQNRMLRESNT